MNNGWFLGKKIEELEEKIALEAHRDKVEALFKSEIKAGRYDPFKFEGRHVFIILLTIVILTVISVVVYSIYTEIKPLLPAEKQQIGVVYMGKDGKPYVVIAPTENTIQPTSTPTPTKFVVQRTPIPAITPVLINTRTPEPTEVLEELNSMVWLKKNGEVQNLMLGISWQAANNPMLDGFQEIWKKSCLWNTPATFDVPKEYGDVYLLINQSLRNASQTKILINSANVSQIRVNECSFNDASFSLYAK